MSPNGVGADLSEPRKPTLSKPLAIIQNHGLSFYESWHEIRGLFVSISNVSEYFICSPERR